jgi:hypothetical protein
VASSDLLINDLCDLIKSNKIECSFPQLTDEAVRKSTRGLEKYPIYEDAIRYVLQRQKLINNCLHVENCIQQTHQDKDNEPDDTPEPG